MCPLMKLVSAWLNVIPLQCVLTFSGDLLEVHEVIVYQLWLCVCSPLHAWPLASYSYTESLRFERMKWM